jgi:hypothetical protein
MSNLFSPLQDQLHIQDRRKPRGLKLKPCIDSLTWEAGGQKAGKVGGALGRNQFPSQFCLLITVSLQTCRFYIWDSTNCRSKTFRKKNGICAEHVEIPYRS